ncbi:MAG TPA: GxxExxY protein [Geothrix sp.]|jgi:GxxExxY protein
MLQNDPLSEKVLGCVFKVSSSLGVGFVEKVYENALVYELRKQGLGGEQQKGLEVWYDGVAVGDFTVDLLVEGTLLVELKAVKALDDMHLSQALNYLRASGQRVCLLINMGTSKPEIRRLVPGKDWKPVSHSEER